MSKELKFVTYFLILSLILLAVFSGYYWWESRDELASLSHIGHPEWSPPQKLYSQIHGNRFSALPIGNNVLSFYLTREFNTKEETLHLQKSNFQGKTSLEKELLTRQSLNTFAATKTTKGKINLFFISGQSDADQVLWYYLLDDSLQVLKKRKLVTDLNYTYSLNTYQKEDNVFVAFTSMKNNNYTLDLLKFNDKKLKIASQREIPTKGLQCRLPEFKWNKGKLFLTYLKQDPERLFQSSAGKRSKSNTYHLIIQEFDQELKPLNKPVILDNAYLRGESSRPKIRFSDNELHVFYHKYLKNEHNKIMLRNITYKPGSEQRLSISSVGNTSIGSVDFLQSENSNYMVYNIQDKNSILYITKFANFSDINLDNTRLFTRNRYSYQPDLYKINNDLHISWVELNNGDNHLHYANTVHPRKPGFLEVLGLKFSNKDMGYITTPMYFLSLPIVSWFTTIHFIGIAIGVLVLAHYLNVKFEIGFINEILNNIYYIFTFGIGLMLAISSLFFGYKKMFYPGPPPEGMIPFILGGAFIGVLLMLKQFRTDSDRSMFIGLGSIALFFYWINMINLIFYGYKYFY